MKMVGYVLTLVNNMARETEPTSETQELMELCDPDSRTHECLQQIATLDFTQGVLMYLMIL